MKGGKGVFIRNSTDYESLIFRSLGHPHSQDEGDKKSPKGGDLDGYLQRHNKVSTVCRLTIAEEEWGWSIFNSPCRAWPGLKGAAVA